MMKSLLRTLTVGLMLTVISQGHAVEDSASPDDVAVPLKDNHPDVYYVQPGDTLWEISSRFLSNPWQWPELWHRSDEIQNPHLIYPGDVIRLEHIDGHPRLVVERTEKVSPEDAELIDGERVVRLSPRIRELPLTAAIPAIPMEKIQTFLKEGLVVTAEEIAEAPYVVGGYDSRVRFAIGDTIHVRDPLTSWERLLQDYGIYRVGEEYVDPETRELLGYEALQIGHARVTDHDNELATMRVTRASEELKAQDRIFSSRERRVQSVFYPSAPEKHTEATIIRLFGRLNRAARDDVVVINKGASDGLREGNVLEAMQRGELVRDRIRDEAVQLPHVKSGTIILFNVFERVSYGLIIESTRPISKTDIVRSPINLQ